MKKIIIYEPELVRPIWPKLEYSSLGRLSKAVTRKVRWGGEEAEVLDVPPIVVTEFNESILALDGKNRCAAASRRGVPLRACLIESIEDINNRLPHECLLSLSGRIDPYSPLYSIYGIKPYTGEPIDWAREHLVIAFENRDLYVGICEQRGIRTVYDLISSK